VNKLYTEMEHLTAKCNPSRYF